jgi:hypothetical protein
MGCFPRLYVDRIKSLGFRSKVVALGLSRCFSARVARLTAAVSVKTVCIDTLSWIANRNPPVNLATYSISVSISLSRQTINNNHRQTLGLCELLVGTLGIVETNAAQSPVVKTAL